MKINKQFRINKKLSQAELGELLNVTNNTISQWEGGGRIPSLKKAKRLAEILSCTIDELVADDDTNVEK